MRFDPEVKNYVQSIQKSGASADQVQGIVNSVETLALAKRGAGEAGDSASAASAAVKSFFGKFDYLPNGGARVPAKSFDAVTANAQATIDGLALDHIAVPQRFGQPGQPEARNTSTRSRRRRRGSRRRSRTRSGSWTTAAAWCGAVTGSRWRSRSTCPARRRSCALRRSPA